MNDIKQIEKSIIKKYRKELWSPFIKGINEFNMIEENDKIAVCISGGKDSILLAKMLEELQKYSKVKFSLEYIVMNPGYNKVNMDKLISNLELFNIKAHIFETNIFKVSTKLNSSNPCYMCARMRRGNLYNKAKELGCNKIALGHHFDDVVETILLNMFYAGNFGSMLPKLRSDNFEEMELIRPLYFVNEDSIIKWVNYNNLSFLDCACSIASKNIGKRKEIKDLLKVLSIDNPDIKYMIYKSSLNVNLDTIISYKLNKEYYSYYDNYK